MNQDNHPAGTDPLGQPPGRNTASGQRDLPDTALSVRVDGAISLVGKAFSWFWLFTVAVILVSVISRYGFSRGSVMLEEFTWHLVGFAWLMGLAYTLVTDEHVRVDVLRELLSPRGRAWLEMGGLLLLLFPFLAITVYYSSGYAYNSFMRGETSPSPSGLPYRFLLKSAIPIALTLLGIAALGRLSRCTAFLFGFPRARARGIVGDE